MNPFEKKKKQPYLTLEDVDVSDKTVVVRVDINSPIDLKTLKVRSDTRIRLHAKTLKELSDLGAKVVVLAHQGRKGDPDLIPLKSHVETLERVLGQRVKYVTEVIGEKATRAIKELLPGEILVLENVRLHPDELLDRSPVEHSRSQLARNLASLADLFVLDGFSVAHRSHCSVVGLTPLMQSVAGRVMEAELSVMDKINKEFKRPFICFLGGSKVEKGSEFVEFLLEKGVDLVLTGGLAGNLLMHSSGINIGEINLTLLRKKRLLEHGERMKEVLYRYPHRAKIPIDVAVRNDDGSRLELKASELPTKYPIHDIGSETIRRYIDDMDEARTVFVTGPLGLYEEEAFAKGTFEVFKAIADSKAFTIASGGHTVSSLRFFGLEEKFTYTSIAGGAFLEHMMGKKLPGIESLKVAAERLR